MCVLMVGPNGGLKVSKLPAGYGNIFTILDVRSNSDYFLQHECDLTFFSAVFQLYQDDGWLITKDCVRWNPVYFLKRSLLT